MKSLRTIFWLMLNLNCLVITGQSNYIECYNLMNCVESSLKSGDTTTALIIFESLDEKYCSISKNFEWQLGRVYYMTGNQKESERHFERAIDKGIWGGIDYGDNVQSMLKEIESKFGKSYLIELEKRNRQLIDEKMKLYGGLISDLRWIYEEDQKLRKDKVYKECKRYNFNFRLGFSIDSTKNHEEMIKCSEEFRLRDSILLSNFVKIIDSLKFVPGDSIIFNMLPIDPIINHTAHFDFENLSDFYLNSMLNGSLSPRVFAWYQGYNEEYFLKEYQLYFTNNESYFDNLKDEEIMQINRKRIQVGLPLCPAVVWNTNIH